MDGKSDVHVRILLGSTIGFHQGLGFHEGFRILQGASGIHEGTFREFIRAFSRALEGCVRGLRVTRKKN